MRRFYLPSQEDLNLADVLYALSDPTRLQIVARLAGAQELPCGVSCLSTPKSTLSHHLKVLRETGIITTRAEGTQAFNSLRRVDLDARFPGLLDAVLHGIRTCRIMNPDLKPNVS